MIRDPLHGLIARLRDEQRVWVRASARNVDGKWVGAQLEVTLTAPPPGWRSSRWLYPRAMFSASIRKGNTVAGWLAAERMRMGSKTVRLPMDGSLSCEWRESEAASMWEPLNWPSRVWTFRSNVSGGVLQEELVARDAPAFLSFDEAARALFCIPRFPNRHFAGVEIVVREQLTAARIDSVKITPADVRVELSGGKLAGAQLTYGGDQGSTTLLTSTPTGIRLPIDTPPATGAWIALHDGGRLLDRRVLDPAWRRGNVRVEVDLATEVEILISGGEGPGVEFKRQLPDRDPVKSMKSISAFANGDGGTIIFGVEDDAEVIGVEADDLPSALDRLTTLIAGWTKPPVNCTPRTVQLDGKNLIIVSVPPGPEPPYAVGTTDERLTYYVRRGATSVPARPTDIRSAVWSRIPVDVFLP